MYNLAYQIYFTKILNKLLMCDKLNKKEVEFLNGLDRNINEENYEELINISFIKRLCSIVFNVKESEVAYSLDEFLTNPKNYKVLVDSLDLDYIDHIDNSYIPDIIINNFTYNNITSLGNVKMPYIVGGSLNLNGLKTVNSKDFPKYIGGDLNLRKALKVEYLFLDSNFTGQINLDNVEAADKIYLGSSKVELLYTPSMEYAVALCYPFDMNSDIILSKLKKCEILDLPRNLYGNLSLESYENIDGVRMPHMVSGYVDLSGIKRTKELILPNETGNLYLTSLENASNVVFPNDIRGYVFMFNLRTTRNLKLPRDFDIKYLYCDEELKDEIYDNPYLYRKEIVPKRR